MTLLLISFNGWLSAATDELDVDVISYNLTQVHLGVLLKSDDSFVRNLTVTTSGLEPYSIPLTDEQHNAVVTLDYQDVNERTSTLNLTLSNDMGSKSFVKEIFQPG